VIAVLALALLIRVIYLYLYQALPDWNFLTVDNYYHHHWAQRLAAGDLLGGATYFRAPFYIYCLGLLYSVFGSSLWVGRIFGLIVGLGSIFLTFRIAERVFERRAAIIAALIQSLLPIMIYFESELLLDPLFMLLLQVAIYFFVVWYDDKTNRSLWLAGLFLGLASITRPTALAVAPIFLIALFFKRSESNFKLNLARLSLPIVLIVGLIFARNLIVAGDPVLISSQGGINFYIGNSENADGLSAVLPEPMGYNWQISQITQMAEKETGRTLKPSGVSSWWRNRALGWIVDNPRQFISLYIKKIWYNLSSTEVSNNRSLPGFFAHVLLLKYNPLSFGILFLLAVIGIAAHLKENQKLKPLVAIIGTYVLVTALFFFSSRFRLPLLPLYAILAGGAVGSIRQIIIDRSRLVTAIVAGTAAALITFLPLFGYSQSITGQSVVSRGLAYLNEGDYNTALETFRRAQAINPDFPELNLNLGVLFIKEGQIDSALVYLEKERRLYPLRPKSYTNLATLALLDSNQVAAERYAQKAVDLNPADITAHRVLLRAIAMKRTLTIESFANHIDDAYTSSSDNVYLLNEAAIIISQHGLIQLAEVLLQRAAVGNPPPIETDDLAFQANFPNSLDRWHHEQGRSYHQLSYLAGRENRFDDAVAYAKRAIALNPELTDAYVNLITGLRMLGKFESADSVLTEAKARFPNNPNLRSMQP